MSENQIVGLCSNVTLAAVFAPVLLSYFYSECIAARSFVVARTQHVVIPRLP